MGRRKATDNYAEPVNKEIRIKYIKCPLCGFTQPLKKYKERSEKIRFGKIPPESFEFLSIREGGGWKSGFHKAETKTFAEIIKDPEYRKLIEDIKKQCERILDFLEKQS